MGASQLEDRALTRQDVEVVLNALDIFCAGRKEFTPIARNVNSAD
jgi:hypothetical protein